MSTRTDLEKAYNNYFRELFEKLKFEQFSEYSSGMGSVRYFKNVRLKVQLVNDRGIIDLLITGIDSEA